MPCLENKLCYLSGAIEHCDSEFNWRTEPKKILHENFGINVFDPHSDPKQQWVKSLKKAQEDKDIETIVKAAKSFVRKDLCIVDRADFLIAYLPHKIRTTGTTHEIINSNNAKKPTLLVTDNDITQIPLWYFGFIPVEFMFAGWNSLYNYLQKVNTGEDVSDRWNYIRGLI